MDSRNWDSSQIERQEFLTISPGATFRSVFGPRTGTGLHTLSRSGTALWGFGVSRTVRNNLCA